MAKLLNSLMMKDFPSVGTEATSSERIKQTGQVMSYEDVGVTPYGIDTESLGARQSLHRTALQQDFLTEKTPYLNPTALSKGTLVTTLGGRTTFKDKLGNILLTYDPKTGTISIYGGVISQQTLNLGTIYNSELSGTVTLSGTLLGGTISSNHQGGTFSGITINGGTFGTIYMSNVQITNVSMVNPYSSGGTVVNETISGISTYNVGTGSAVLPASGNFQLQKYGTALCIAVRYGGTTFRFNPTGTLP